MPPSIVSGKTSAENFGASNTWSVDGPTSVADDDYIVVVLGTQTAHDVNSVPTGFSIIGAEVSSADTDQSNYVGKRSAVGAGPYVFGFAANESGSASWFVVTGADGSTFLDVAAVQEPSGVGTSKSVGPVVPANDNCLLVGIFSTQPSTTHDFTWGGGFGSILAHNNSGVQSIHIGTKTQTTATSESASGTLSATDEACETLIAIREAAGGAIEEEIGQPSETDAALALGRAKQRPVGVPAETDAALGLAPAKARGVGQPSETDDALPLGAAKVRAVGVAATTDEALPLTPRKTRTLGIASETDTPLTVGRAKTMTIGVASEGDAALPVGRAKAHPIGQPAETDTALGLGVPDELTAELGIAAETDTALPLTPRKACPIGIASETDVPLPVGAGKARGLGIAADVSSALAVGHAKHRALGLPSETDTALAFDGAPVPGGGMRVVGGGVPRIGDQRMEVV